MGVLDYPIVLEWDWYARKWRANVIDLPGCIGVGETEREAVKVARSFIKPWIESALEDGRPVPQPSAME